MPQVIPIKKDSDTIVPVQPRAEYPHIFSGHSLKKTHAQELPRKEDVPVWPAPVLFLPVVLLIYLYVTYSRKLNAVFRAFFTLQNARQLLREDYRLTRRASVILSFVYVVSLSFLLYSYNSHYNIVKIAWPPLVQFHVIFLGVIVMYAVKLFTNSVLGFIIDAQAEVKEYNFNIFLSAQGAGIFLLPLAFCVQYLRQSPAPFFITGAGVFSLFYLLRLAKGVLIGMESRNFSAFHLFLYLCALEILPLIVLITFLIRLNSWLGV